MRFGEQSKLQAARCTHKSKLHATCAWFVLLVAGLLALRVTSLDFDIKFLFVSDDVSPIIDFEKSQSKSSMLSLLTLDFD